MARKNKSSLLKSFFRLLLGKKKEKDVSISKNKSPQAFGIEWKNAYDKYKHLLLTKQVDQGTVVERTGYKLIKTSDKLFRLEGETFSVIIMTGNTLYPNKDGKTAGILFVDEGELNQAIQSEFSKLEGFLNRVSLSKMDFTQENEVIKAKDWKIILSWPRFWKEQLLLQFSANTMALIILALGEEGKKFFEDVATDRQETLVRDEFFFLNAGKTSETNSPHGKNRNLFSFNKALKEFSDTIILLDTKREKENVSHEID